MAKSRLIQTIIGASSGLLLVAFFFIDNDEVKPKSLKKVSQDAILLSYIPPVEYIGKQEYLIATSLKQPIVFDQEQFTDAFLEIESFVPMIDSVIHIPNEFKFKQKALLSHN